MTQEAGVAEVAVQGTKSVEDQIKLRELELATQYELKFLSDNFRELKRYVETKLDNESDRFETLNKKVTLLTYFIVVQLTGLDIERLITLLKNAPF